MTATNDTSQANAPLSLSKIEQLRYPREYTYFLIGAIFGGLVWLVVLISSFGLILLYGLIFAGLLAIASLFFRARILGNAVMVSETQFPEIYALVRNGAIQLGLRETPRTFILPGNGILNAFAIRFIGTRYVVLMAETVDFALLRKKTEELRFIILHELTHHAVGHTAWWKNLLIYPAKLIPFLGAAYSRACEYTCDRVASYLISDTETSSRALLMLGHGSIALADSAKLEPFAAQDQLIPPFIGFIAEILSSHPRLTRRIAEIRATSYIQA